MISAGPVINDHQELIMGYQDRLAALRRDIEEIMPDEVQGMIEDGDDFVLVDVREPEEIRQGTLPGAKALPRGYVATDAERVIGADKDAQVVAYCAGGVRSLFAAEELATLGYGNVSSMAGGFGRWSDMGFDINESPAAFSSEQAPAAAVQGAAIGPNELKAQLDSGLQFVVLDVRDADQVDSGRIAGSLHIARGFLELKIEANVPDKSTTIILHDQAGERAPAAAAALEQLGYSAVSVLTGGYAGWEAAGLPVDKPFVLSDEDRARYARHLNIPEVGPEGQAKLLQSRVLLIGAGGLGCPTAQYLAAAGIGTLGILDFDVVDESNLQRQVLHNIDTIGVAKVESAKRNLAKLNPGIKLVTHNTRIDSTNVEEIFSQYDVVVDGTDNFPTRYLINDCCVKLGIPNVHGSVYRFDGQVTVFAPTLGGPCYRCLYPEPPPPELAPSCAEAGVLGVLPGIIGCLQAMETIKVILNIGEAFVGKLLVYNALKAEKGFEVKKLFKDHECAYCAAEEFPGFVDYDFFCSNPAVV
jgi:molybdopterin/thiamine biosynthesis adenylyltransferase/rhodanese-related sulfurtransferase